MFSDDLSEDVDLMTPFALEDQTNTTQVECEAQIILKWLADKDLSSEWSVRRMWY